MRRVAKKPKKLIKGTVVKRGNEGSWSEDSERQGGREKRLHDWNVV